MPRNTGIFWFPQFRVGARNATSLVSRLAEAMEDVYPGQPWTSILKETGSELPMLGSSWPCRDGRTTRFLPADNDGNLLAITPELLQAHSMTCLGITAAAPNAATAPDSEDDSDSSHDSPVQKKSKQHSGGSLTEMIRRSLQDSEVKNAVADAIGLKCSPDELELDQFRLGHRYIGRLFVNSKFCNFLRVGDTVFEMDHFNIYNNLGKTTTAMGFICQKILSFLRLIAQTVFGVEDKEHVVAFISIFEKTYNVLCDVAKCVLSDVTVTAADFDETPGLFPFTNGVFDLNEMKFRIPRKDEYVSVTCGHFFDEKAFQEKKYERAEAFLDSLFPDVDSTRWFKKHLASLLIRANREEKLYIWLGATANGKSATQAILRKAMGKTAKDLNANNYTATPAFNSPQCEMTDCIGAHVVFTTEVNNVKLLANRVKQITGGDPFPVRRLYGDSVLMNFWAKPIFSSNCMPRFDAENDDAIDRRVEIVVFPMKFVNQEEMDPNNPLHKLRDPDLKGGDFAVEMLYLMLHWYPIYKAEPLFPMPPGLQEPGDALKKKIRPMSKWLQGALLFVNGGSADLAMLYDHYRTRDEVTAMFLSFHDFVEKVKRCGYKVVVTTRQGRQAYHINSYTINFSGL